MIPEALTPQNVLFYLFSFIAVVSALGVVLVRHIVYAALLLGLCFTSVAGLYGVLGADFIFAVQVMIYVGAIAVLFLFVILLAGRRSEISAAPYNRNVLSAAIAAVLLLALIGGVYAKTKFFLGVSKTAAFKPTTALIGEALLGPYAIGMEILGLVLLIALVGASLLAPSRHTDKKEEA